MESEGVSRGLRRFTAVFNTGRACYRRQELRLLDVKRVFRRGIDFPPFYAGIEDEERVVVDSFRINRLVNLFPYHLAQAVGHFAT